MYDVIALGELLVDFTLAERAGRAARLPGESRGSAVQCFVHARQTGRRTAFIGKVGHDMFGKMLRNTLREAGG